jgi:hypothetical protein
MSKVKMDMRWKADLNHPDAFIDLQIDDYSVETLGCSTNRYFYLLAMVREMPDEDVNKPELLRYVDRARAAFREKNLDALEGWINALRVSVKVVRLFIPKTAGRVKQEDANRKNAQLDRKASPEAIEAFRANWLSMNPGRTRGLQKAIQLEFGIKDVRTINRKRMKTE